MRLYVHMPHPFVLHVPVELGLELLAAASPNCLDTEGKPLQYIIDETHGIDLVVSLIDLECTYPCGIVYSRILETADHLAVGSFEGENLDVYLDVVAGNLLRIATGVQSAAPYPVGESPEPMAHQNPVNT